MTKSKHRFLNIVLILLPVIDVFTSITTRFLENSITIGTIIKGLMMAYFVFYVTFLTNSKFKKASIINFCLIFGFILFYFLSKNALLSFDYFFTELSYLVKLSYLPILFSGLLCYYDDSGFSSDKMDKIILINVILYMILLLIPFLTNSAFETYKNGGLGYIGWYYSGNEISALLILLFPFIYKLIMRKKILFFLLILLTSFVTSLVGTKVAMLGNIIVGCILLIVTFFIKNTGHKWKTIFNSTIALIIICFMMYDSFAVQNMNRIVENTETSIQESLEVQEFLNSDEATPVLELALNMLSGRDIYLVETHKIYNERFNISTVLFGLGYSNTPKIDNINITKLIEIDILDIFYHTGVVGLVITLLPFVFVLIMLIKEFKKNKMFNEKILFYVLMILLICGISCLSGHVLLDPAVSIYVALYLILLVNELGLFKKPKLKENKVQIISLHLGYGGGERATIDLANMLSEKYEVELISLYKTVDNPPFKISSKVKVVYLTDTKPNKEEFKNALKTYNFFKILSEGFKAMRILYLKYILVKNIILYSDSKYFVSSRFYFTKLLNKYARKDAVTIAIEHNYNLDENFVKKLKRNSQNIDSLVCVSKTASKIYKDYIPGLNINWIPNIVSDEYDVVSNLKEKQLIYVGRLEEEKGTKDLIELMKKINDKDSKVTLNIFGDGSLREEMQNQINEYNLKENVKIHGFKDAKYIGNYYKDSSMFVLVSHQESFGIVLIESMKCGVPVIAFDEATGAKELIENNKNGYLIKHRDINKMADQILKYLNLKAREKKAFQKNAFETSQKYSASIVKKKWYELFTNIIKDKNL